MRNLLFLFSLFFIMSCTNTRVTTREIGGDNSPVVQKKLVGDVNVDLSKKISGTAINTKGNQKDAKQMAIWNCLFFSGAHTLVDPIYKTVITGKVITVEVTGYHATYENFNLATEQDIINYIRYNLLRGNGILNVSFEEFRAFYKSLVVDQEFDECDIMNDEELRIYFNHEVKQAKKNFQPTSKKRRRLFGKLRG